MIVIIPAYQPDEKLVKLVRQLKAETDYPIVIVDDGCTGDSRNVFGQLEADAVILHHEINCGKGKALRTAMEYIYENYPHSEGIVTVDADGQHLVKDIVRVSEAWESNKKALVLGSRRFTGKVPFKSRAGNAITRCVFAVSTGVRVFDTQTGLRAYSAARIPMMLEMKGDRYEYEINVLLYSTRHKVPIEEVTIDTVYIEDNQSSHFNPIRDAWRIYKMIGLFVASSVAAFVIDVGGFSLLRLFGISKPLAEIVARVVSSLCNYVLNRKFVFEGRCKSSVLRYYVLALCILAADYGILSLLSLIMPEWVAKILSGLVLYPVSFYFQRKFVFPVKEEELQNV